MSMNHSSDLMTDMDHSSGMMMNGTEESHMQKKNLDCCEDSSDCSMASCAFLAYLVSFELKPITLTVESFNTILNQQPSSSISFLYRPPIHA